MGVTGSGNAHNARCGERIRVRLLAAAGDPSEPSITLRHRIADEIERCCRCTPLKAYRVAWGWTVERAVAAFHDLCEREKLSPRGLGQRSWIGWEAGGKPDDDYRDRLCRLFRTSGIRLGYASDYTPRMVSSGRDAEAGERTGKAAPVDETQREATAVAALDAGGEAMEFTRRAEASDVGPRSLEHLELAITTMAAAFPYTPPAELFPRARQYRRHVDRFIAGKHTVRQLRELYRDAGWLSIILAWLNHDLGDTMTAEAYCVDAWEHGWQAEYPDICAWSMDAAATIAMYSGRSVTGRDAAARGLAVARSGSAASVRLLCQLMRAHARLGGADAFSEGLRATKDRLDVLAELGSGLFSADGGRVAAYAAIASIWLDQPRQAAAFAEDALAFYRAVPAERRSPTREAISRLDLGLALVHLKQPDEAIGYAVQALETDRVTGSVLTRAEDVGRALVDAYPQLPAARHFHELRQGLAATVARQQITAG